jgi:hypothetical protein
MLGGHDRYRLLGDVDAQREQPRVDRREMADDELGGLWLMSRWT